MITFTTGTPNKPFQIQIMSEIVSTCSLVKEAQDTNYWSNPPHIHNTKRKKAKEKKRWAKIRRKQGR
jgi:hypothetical protein